MMGIILRRLNWFYFTIDKYITNINNRDGNMVGFSRIDMKIKQKSFKLHHTLFPLTLVTCKLYQSIGN